MQLTGACSIVHCYRTENLERKTFSNLGTIFPVLSIETFSFIGLGSIQNQLNKKYHILFWRVSKNATLDVLANNKLQKLEDALVIKY